MSKAYIIETATGRLKYYGQVRDKKSLMDGDTPKDGYSLLPGDTPRPPDDLLEPIWDGTQWQPGPADKKTRAEQQAERLDSDPLLAALVAELAGVKGVSEAKLREDLLGRISE